MRKNVQLLVLFLLISAFFSCSVIRNTVNSTQKQEEVISVMYIQYNPASISEVVGKDSIRYWLENNLYNNKPISLTEDKNQDLCSLSVYRKIIREINSDLAACKCDLEIRAKFLIDEDGNGYISFFYLNE